MAIPKRTNLTAPANKAVSSTDPPTLQNLSRLPNTTVGPRSLIPPGSPGVNVDTSSADINAHQDPDIALARKKIEDLRTEENKAAIALLEADTNRAMWLETEQNNREILRASKQLHYDAHTDHISTEYEAAEDQEISIRRTHAKEQGIIAQTEYEQARTALREIRDQIQEATREYRALIKYKLTGQWEQDINNFVNPFVRFGPWGQKYGWYLLAFIVFAVLVLLFIH